MHKADDWQQNALAAEHFLTPNPIIKCLRTPMNFTGIQANEVARLRDDNPAAYQRHDDREEEEQLVSRHRKFTSTHYKIEAFLHLHNHTLPVKQTQHLMQTVPLSHISLTIGSHAIARHKSQNILHSLFFSVGFNNSNK